MTGPVAPEPSPKKRKLRLEQARQGAQGKQLSELSLGAHLSHSVRVPDSGRAEARDPFVWNPCGLSCLLGIIPTGKMPTHSLNTMSPVLTPGLLGKVCGVLTQHSTLLPLPPTIGKDTSRRSGQMWHPGSDSVHGW